MKLSFVLPRSVIRSGALAIVAVALLALAAAYGYERYSGFREALRRSAADAAIAAARNPSSIEGSARLALDKALDDTAVMEIETGVIDPAGTFQVSTVRVEAVRVRLTAGFDLIGLSGLGLAPGRVSAEATVRRFPIAALTVSTDDRSPSEEAGRFALARVFGVPVEIATAAAAVEARFAWSDLSRLLAVDGHSPAVASVGAVLAAAAAALDRGQLRDRAALDALAAAVPEDLPSLSLETILSVRGLPAGLGAATEFETFGLSGGEMVAAIGRSLAAHRPVGFALDRPADGVARIEVEIGAAAQAEAATPSRAVGSAGAAVTLPSLRLVAKATIYGLSLPGASQIEIPVEVTVADGGATIRDIGCDLAAPERRRALLVLRPLRADVLVRELAEPEEGAAASPSEDFVTLVAADDYTVWLRGQASMPATRPTEVLVPAAELGTVQTARVPVDLASLVGRAVVDGEIHVSTASEAVPAAAIRDEIHRALRFAGPGLSSALTAVLRGFGLAPGSVSASVQQISCNGVELLP